MKEKMNSLAIIVVIILLFSVLNQMYGDILEIKQIVQNI